MVPNSSPSRHLVVPVMFRQVLAKTRWQAELRTLLTVAVASTALGACSDAERSSAPDFIEEQEGDPVQDDRIVPLTPCEMAYGQACDAPCDDETPCETGLHCKNGACVSDCFDDDDCSEGICNKKGKCYVESQIALPTDLDSEEPEEDNEVPACVEGEVEFEAVMPQVWLLLDRSSSMNNPMGDVTQWEALGAVLFGEPEQPDDRGVVGGFEDRVAFGATFYTMGSGPVGCALDLESVALAANNYSAIRHRYARLVPTGGTPTADSVAAVVAEASTRDLTGGPKILVLATDGVPGPCAERGGGPTDEVEHEVKLAFAKEIQTFAISISTATDAAHMQRVANLGVGLEEEAEPPAPYYTAESQRDLFDAFNAVISTVPRSCVFSLNGDVDEENAGEGTVVLAGQELGYRAKDGWVLKQADQVELVGDACAAIREGEEELDITFPCAVFTPGAIR